MSVSFGIHFGNSNCCIAVNKGGVISTVTNPSGLRVTPSLITFRDNGVFTGEAAKNELVKYSQTTVGGIVRCLEAKAPEDVVFPYGLKCQIVSEKKRLKFSITVEEKQRSVNQEDFIRKIFTLLKEIASPHSPEGKLPSVISIAPWVNESLYPVITECATTSGFKILTIVKQPSALCLAYNLLGDITKPLNVLTFHCGGTSVVAGVGEIRSGMFAIKEYSNPSSTAGDEITHLIAKYLATEFFRKYKADPLENRRSRTKLFNAAAECKHMLSQTANAKVYIESLWEGVDFSTTVSRIRFESMIQSTLQEFIKPIKEVLERCSLTVDQIDKVILCGGGCKMPKLQQLVSSTLPKAEILKQMETDEVSAIGAAEEAFFHVEQKLPKHTTNPLLTVLKMPIYVIIADGESQLVFPAGSPGHSRQSLTHKYTDKPNNVVLYESEKVLACPSEDEILATLDIAGMAAEAQIQFDFLIKSDCSIAIKVRNSTSKKGKTFVIESEKSS